MSRGLFSPSPFQEEGRDGGRARRWTQPPPWPSPWKGEGKRTLHLAGALIVCLCWSGAVIGADAGNEHGRKVYRKWCAPCHAPGPETHPGTEALTAKYGDGKPGALEERTDLTVEYTKQMVRQGVSIMPFFRQTEISDADLEALAAYLARSR